jgi:hypothetical protein
MTSFQSVKGTELSKIKIVIAGIINKNISIKNYKDHLSVFNTLFIPANEKNGSSSNILDLYSGNGQDTKYPE